MLAFVFKGYANFAVENAPLPVLSLHPSCIASIALRSRWHNLAERANLDLGLHMCPSSVAVNKISSFFPEISRDLPRVSPARGHWECPVFGFKTLDPHSALGCLELRVAVPRVLAEASWWGGMGWDVRETLFPAGFQPSLSYAALLC